MSTEGNAKNYIELRGSLSLPEAIHGKSAYEIAVMNGFNGTEEEWLYSLAAEANTTAQAYANNAADSAARAKRSEAAAKDFEASAEEWAQDAEAGAQNARESAVRAEEAARNAAGEAAIIAAEEAARNVITGDAVQAIIDNATESATKAAEEEVTRLVGELDVVQTTGDSVTAVMSQKAVTDELYITKECDVEFENGYYATINGIKGAAAAWIRTVSYLDDNIESIEINSTDYGMILYIYDASGAFLGLFRKSDSTIAPSTTYCQELDIALVRRLYPDYKFTLSVKRLDGSAIDIDSAIAAITVKGVYISLKDMIAPKDDEYIGFEGDTVSKVIEVTKNSIYVKVTEQLHNSLSFYGVDGADRVPLLMQSVDTGASAFYVSYSGVYKINVDGYSQIEMRRENGGFVCDVYLVDEKNVTYSTIEKRPQNYYPIRTYDYKEFSDSGVTIWGVRNGKLFGTIIHNGLELYEIDIETGSKTKVGTNIYPYGGANALQCEILDNGTVMFLLNGGRVVRSTDLNTWTEVKNIGMNMYIYGSFRQIDSHKNIVILSEYRLPAEYTSETDKAGRKLFLSTDYGESFTEIFDLADHIPSVAQGHIHSIAYDRYDDIIWVVTGDTYDMIYFSKDLGATWYQATKEYKDCNIQMTSIIPLADCVLFGTDCPILGVARYNKPTTGMTDGIELTTRKGTDMKFDFPFYITPRYIGTVPVASRPAIDYEKSIAYFGYTVAVEGEQGLVCHGEVYATNGHVFKEVYRADEKVTLGTVSVYGDFKNNRCIAKHNTAGAWVVIDTK